MSYNDSQFCRSCGAPLAPDARFCPNCGANADVSAADAVVLSGWWRRVGAYLLDSLIISGFILAIAAVVGLFALAGGVKHVSSGGYDFTYTEPSHDTYGNYTGDVQQHYHLLIAPWFWSVAVIGILGVLAVYCCYAGLLMRRPGKHNGQTWGRQATGIRVARDSGEPVTFWFAFLREVLIKMLLVGVIGAIPFVGWLGEIIWFLWPLWDKTNRAPQDMMVNTHVIRVDDRPQPASLTPIAVQ